MVVGSVVPMVLEQDGRMERSFDIYSRLLRERIVFLGQEVNDDIANLIAAQLLLPRRRGAGEGHLPLRQLARRLGVRRHGDLRRDAVRAVGRLDRLPRDGHERRRDDPLRRRGREAVRAAEREDHDPPGLGRLPRHARRHPDRGARDPRHDEADGGDHLAPLGPGRRPGAARHRPRPLHDAGGGRRVRPRRCDHGAAWAWLPVDEREDGFGWVAATSGSPARRTRCASTAASG